MKIKKHKWSWLKGFSLEVLSSVILFVFAIISSVLAPIFLVIFLGGRLPLAILTIMIILLIIGGGILYSFIPRLSLKGRKIRVQKRIENRSKRRKPEVIYLRPFKRDQLLGDFVSNISPITYEEQIAAVLSDFGNVFALNPPQKDLYDLGAYRISAGIDDWQKKVDELLASAKLVVLLVGVSPGVLWELSRLLTMDDLTKVLILVPHGKEHYKLIEEKIKSETGFHLPGYQEGDKCPGDLVGIIYFTPDGRPHFRKFNKKFAQSNYRTPLKPLLKMAIEPVYKQLKVKWRKQPSVFWTFRIKSYLRKIFFSLLLLLALFIIFKETESCVNYNIISAPPCPTCLEAEPAIDELIKPIYIEFIRKKFTRKMFRLITAGTKRFVIDSVEMSFNEEIRTRHCKAEILFDDVRDSIVFKVTPLGYRFMKGIAYKVEIIDVIPAKKKSMLLELIGKENTGIVEDSLSFSSSFSSTD